MYCFLSAEHFKNMIPFTVRVDIVEIGKLRLIQGVTDPSSTAGQRRSWLCESSFSIAVRAVS